MIVIIPKKKGGNEFDEIHYSFLYLLKKEIIIIDYEMD